MRTRYFLLAVLFAIAVAFQLTVLINTLEKIWTSAHQFHPGLLTDWALQLNLRFLNPFACLLLGFYVAKARISDAKAWLVMGVLLSFSVLFNGSNWPDEIMHWHTPLRHAALIYRSTALLSWPFWLMLFAVYFPERPSFDQRHPAVKWLLLGPVAAASVFAVATRVVLNESGAYQSSLAPLNGRVIYTLLWIGILFFLAVLLARLFSSRNPDQLRRLRVLVAGLAASFLPALLVDSYARFQGIWVDRMPGWLLVTSFGLVLLFPLTLAYVTVVQRALDVGVILRQGLQYAMARRGLVLLQIVTSVVVILLVSVYAGRLHFAQRVLLISIGIGVVFLTSVLIHFVGRWLDRRFFREAYRAEQILAQLSDTVGSLADLPGLLAIVVRRVREALHVEDAAVFLSEPDGYRLAFADGGSPPESPGAFGAGSETIRMLESAKRALPVYTHDRTSWAAELPEHEKNQLEKLRSQLLVPLTRRDDLLGFMSLGPRAAEAPYAPRDIDLLQSVAQQTALAIENTRLTAKVAAEIAEREVIERELAIAREVQQRLLPHVFPNTPGLNGFGFCRPAREVGGDYYDFLPLPNGGLGIAIGDVAGKGVPASLLMASLQASLRGQTLSGCDDLTRLVANVNRLVHSTSPENRYATFFYGEYDPCARRFTYVNAGHNSPILMCTCSGVKRLDTGGPPVGLLPVAPYQSAALDLHTGDRLVLFTDGVSEAMNSHDEEWGEENLIAALQSAAAGEPEELAHRIFTSADAFAAGAPQHDDMTVVVVSVL
ncbi:MAG TPA: GAF domain-containing SpoIIE family protein phosphatase [Bryobacteraceae bacterium]|jgi:sigma-B regulation protein RsbU (phosphoserine phosphatase)|nr:GAF domain-containing SpoIIE family protein phosphatase [Bryobacteraceae bacterium]